MPHELPPLPYAEEALEPHVSRETIQFHYGKHHQTYVNNLNNMVGDTEFADSSLAEIIVNAPAGPIFNNAAQVWNHTCYWNSMKPNGGGAPGGALGEAIDKAFGSFDDFKKEFSARAAGNFGSGWTWLVKNSDGSVSIENTSNAGCPLTNGQTPLLTCDVWEHAYYIDYRNARPAYVAAWWNLVNWESAEAAFAA